MQTVAVAAVGTYAWLKLRREGIGGHITAATIRLAWHADVHNRTGIVVLALGAATYAVGSILVARPFMSRPLMLFVVVPLGAAIGVLALGALALVAALLIVLVANNLDLPMDLLDRRDDGRTRGKRR